MPPAIIPAPVRCEPLDGAFVLRDGAPILVDDPALHPVARHLRRWLAEDAGVECRVDTAATGGADPAAGDGAILLSLRDPGQGPEGYELEATARRVVIRGAAAAGVFYGAQTLRQLLAPGTESPVGDVPNRARMLPAPGTESPVGDVPNGARKSLSPETESPVGDASNGARKLPACRVADRPRFPWRGLLLDCCRHFMPLELIKKQIDLLALHKMNRFHWHLTEDQGWRIEIDAYPRLTAIGAWRRGRDGARHGGFYTKSQIREVVAHAAERHVVVVPEIEMPGHGLAALAAYPHLSCSGGPFEVANGWGVFEDVYCAGIDEVFAFLETVLDEVIDLFPGEHIHIGGDECPKTRWSVCPKCRERMRAENLADGRELQSWFIRRVAAFLKTRNRRLIGWDEILEGGLAPDAVVQSWRGVDGAVAAARAGHDAIVSPTSHAYFDYDARTTSLARVHGFDPVPDGLTAGQARRILGGECNLWTEHIPPERLEAMAFPRLCAMAEALWSPRERRTFAEFHGHLAGHYARLDRLGVKCGDEGEPLAVTVELDGDTRTYRVACAVKETEAVGLPPLEIRYSRTSEAGDEPDADSEAYRQPFTMSVDTTVAIRAFLAGRPYGATLRLSPRSHKALGCPVTLARPPHPEYGGGGPAALVDGLRGSICHKDGRWLGFQAEDLDAVIDLGKAEEIREVGIGCLQLPNAWIFMPTKIVVSTSLDGETFEPAGETACSISPEEQDVRLATIKAMFAPGAARYIRVVAVNRNTCPDRHDAAGGEAWIFVDEIVVE